MSERRYLSAAETADRWKLSQRSVRNYCEKGRVEGRFSLTENGKYLWEPGSPGGKGDRREVRGIFFPFSEVRVRYLTAEESLIRYRLT